MEELFRRNLNMLMAENGISQTDLAAKLGFPRQTLGNWIAGTARPSAYRAGVDTLEEYKAAKADILGKLEALKKEPEPAPLPSLSGVLDILEGDAPTDEKRAAALSVIDRAAFDFSERRLEVFFL